MTSIPVGISTKNDKENGMRKIFKGLLPIGFEDDQVSEVFFFVYRENGGVYFISESKEESYDMMMDSCQDAALWADDGFEDDAYHAEKEKYGFPKRGFLFTGKNGNEILFLKNGRYGREEMIRVSRRAHLHEERMALINATAKHSQNNGKPAKRRGL